MSTLPRGNSNQISLISHSAVLYNAVLEHNAFKMKDSMATAVMSLIIGLLSQR